MSVDWLLDVPDVDGLLDDDILRVSADDPDELRDADIERVGVPEDDGDLLVRPDKD